MESRVRASRRQPILSVPRSPGRAALVELFGNPLGRRFSKENLGVLGQVAGACAGLRRSAPQIRGRPVNVFTQWVGDPDALGSALLLRAVLQSLGAGEVRILTGVLGHPQNRAMVEACGVELRDPNRERLRGGLNCTVDTSPPLGMSNTGRVEPEREFLFVADHHTDRKSVEARCREGRVQRVRLALVGLDVGSTSAFMAAMALALGLLGELGPQGRAAAALGIYTDTSALLHGTTPLDLLMFERLTRDAATRRLLHDLRDYRLPPEWHRHLAPALQRIEGAGAVRVAAVGRVPDANRDVIAEIASELLRVDGTALAIAVAQGDHGMEISLRGDSRLLDDDGPRMVGVVEALLESGFHAVSGYKHQTAPPHRVEGGAHLPHGDPRARHFADGAPGPNTSDAIERCQACGRWLLRLLQEQADRAPDSVRGLL